LWNGEKVEFLIEIEIEIGIGIEIEPRAPASRFSVFQWIYFFSPRSREIAKPWNICICRLWSLSPDPGGS